MIKNNAGYFLESVKSFFTDKEFKQKIKFMLNKLGSFEYEANFKIGQKIDQSSVFVVNNLISRGFPTRPSVFLEQIISDAFSKTKKNVDINGNLSFDFEDSDIDDYIKRAFYFVNRKINISEPVKKSKKEKFAYEFVTKILKENVGEYILGEMQTDLKFVDIYDNFLEENNYSAHMFSYRNANFINDKIDFVIEVPYEINKLKGILIDLDADENIQNTDYILIEQKKKFAQAFNYEYVYIKDGNFENEIQTILNFTYNEYFDKLKKNFDSPPSKTAAGRDALQILLSPFAVARIQKIILETIISGRLNLNSYKWKIAVIERDIPAAAIAVAELNILFENLYILLGKRNILPEIVLTVYRTKDFLKAKTDKFFQGEILSTEQFDKSAKYDLLIDNSIFQKAIFDENTPENSAVSTVKIRSAFRCNKTSSLYFGKMLIYKPLGKNPASQAYNEKIFASLQFFSQSIFRLENFKQNQQQAINLIMQNKSALIILPPASGKTLTYLFSALFQPGSSLIVLSDIITTFEKHHFLKQNYIDKAFYINSFKQKTLGRKNAEENFVNGNSLITFISADMAVDENFIKLNKTSSKNKISYFFIDEAQKFSHFNFDFNISDFTFSASKNQLLKKTPAISFTSDSSHNTVSDLKLIFNIDDDQILTDSNYNQNIKFKVIDAADGETFEKNFAKAFSKSFKRKEFMLGQFFSVKKNQNAKNIIVCNNFDTINKVKQFLSNEFSNIKIFTAAPHSFSEYYAQTQINKNFWNDYNEFKKLKRNVTLITNENISEGFDIDYVENIILFGHTPSVEKLYQIAGRAGRKLSEAIIYIIYDEAKTDKTYKTETSTSDGNIETIEEIAKISADKALAADKIDNLFPGRKKEITVINELLDKIDSPEIDFEELLSKKINFEFGKNIKISKQNSKIYLLYDSKNIGFIDADGKISDSKNNAFDADLNYNILSFAKFEIEERFGNVNEFLNFNFNKSETKNVLGIGKQISEAVKGQTIDCEFSAQNSVFDKSLKLIKKYSDKEFVDEILLNIWNQNVYHQKFIYELQSITKINIITPEIDLERKLLDNFYKRRDKKLTEIALYRLKSVNIIDSYTYNENTDKFNVSFTVQSGKFYKESLFKYISAYASPDYVQNIKTNFENYKGQTAVKKCINILVNFTYDYFTKMLFDKIDDSEKLVNKLNTKDEFVNLNQFFYDYFTRKFYNKIIEPSLFFDNTQFEKGNLNTVERYIRKTANSVIHANHILKSAEAALEQNPENYTAKLLLLYADLNTKNSEPYKFIEQLNEIFRTAALNENLSPEIVSAKKKMFLNELSVRNPEIKSQIEPYFIVNDHLLWLKQFNAKFLEGFKTV